LGKKSWRKDIKKEETGEKAMKMKNKKRNRVLRIV